MIEKNRFTDPLLSRRAMLRQTGLGLLGFSAVDLLGAGLATPSSAAAGAKANTALSELKSLHRFPRMMQEYYVQRVRRAEEMAEQRRAAVQSKDAAEAYVHDVRARIQQCFGPWPEKTPLNARIIRVIERDAYRIENVIFESRPGFPVTANLYIPKGRAFPLPGVIGSCGHSANGKASVAYQSFSQGLARQGYVVLLFDPIGQGERLQYTTETLEARHGAGVPEHLMAGNQQFLVGEFFGSWRAWDGIRALDYLLSRPEVDPRHVGITGNSGGGMMTTWLCALDPRWTMAAPSCFVTTFRRNLENELPADTEQCPPRALALGLDHSDFIAALAPKPVILLGQEKDMFDVRGSKESFERLRRLYRTLGAEENIQLFVGPDYHGYSQLNREAMYRWFNRTTGISGRLSEPAIVIEEDETLWCTPRGHVNESRPRTVFSFTRDASRALRQSRSLASQESVKQAVIDALRLSPRVGVPEYRILRPLLSRRYPKAHAITYAVETEPGVFAIVCRLDEDRLLSRPPRGIKRAVLYISHRSADEELRQEGVISELIAEEPNSAIFACDVRGVGDSEPLLGLKSAHLPYGSDYFHAIHGIMFDYPCPAQRTYDVLRVIDWLKANGHEDIHLVAQGWGAIPATFAALLSEAVTQVTLKHALTSFSELAESEDYQWPLSAMLPGVLRHFDLPDCYGALASKKLRQIEPWGAAADKA